MTLQTKEQSMGYILKGLLDTGTDISELKKCRNFLSEIIADSFEISNSDTIGYGNKFVVFTRMKENKVKKFRSDIYWAFDFYTVEEAGELYKAFELILRN